MEATPFSIKIEGLEKLKTAFKLSPLVVKTQVGKAIKLATLLVSREAKIITPVSQGRSTPTHTPGYLRSNIRTEFTPFSGRIVSHAPYSGYVHEGTRNWPLLMPPKKPGTVRQFMKIGAEKSGGQVRLIFQKAINQITLKLAK